MRLETAQWHILALVVVRGPARAASAPLSNIVCRAVEDDLTPDHAREASRTPAGAVSRMVIAVLPGQSGWFVEGAAVFLYGLALVGVSG